MSRLNQDLRVKAGLTYGIQASYSNSPNDGMVVITASVDKSKVEEALKRTESVLAGIGSQWTADDSMVEKGTNQP